MIIGIPTEEGEFVSDHFGRSKYFVIFDTKNANLHKLIENPHQHAATEQSGHGLLLKMLVQNSVNEVICSNLNPRMQQNLESLKIAVKKCAPSATIESIVNHISH